MTSSPTFLCARCGHRNDFHPIRRHGVEYNDTPCLQDLGVTECQCPAFVPPSEDARA